MEQLRQKHVQGSRVNVATIYVLTVISITKPILESYALKIVRPELIKLDYSTTLVWHALLVNSLTHGTNTSARRGQRAALANTYPETGLKLQKGSVPRARPTVYPRRKGDANAGCTIG